MARNMRYLSTIILIGALSVSSSDFSRAQAARKEVFHPDERLVYKVKYGFIKLGTVIIQTGKVIDGTAIAHMEFWTADVPFLHTRTSITDQFDTRDLTIRSFEEHIENVDGKFFKFLTYDPDAKTLTYSDREVTNRVTSNIQPFDDALGILFQMRAWSGAAGHKYLFHVRDHTGEYPVTVDFTSTFSDEQVPAYGDQVIHTRVLKGMMKMGTSSPLGANGAFTAYVTDDAAAIPVRIDMKIAIGSISIVLDKIKRP